MHKPELIFWFAYGLHIFILNYFREVFEVQRDYLEKHHQVLTQGMEYRGELFMMYADDEGIDRDEIIEGYTTVDTPSSAPEPQEELIEVDMFMMFARSHKNRKSDLGSLRIN